jgi:hypothetical protein
MWYFELKGHRYYFSSPAVGITAVVLSFLSVIALAVSLLVVIIMGMYQLGGMLLIITWALFTISFKSTTNGIRREFVLIKNVWFRTLISIGFVVTGLISFIVHF